MISFSIVCSLYTVLCVVLPKVDHKVYEGFAEGNTVKAVVLRALHIYNPLEKSPHRVIVSTRKNKQFKRVIHFIIFFNQSL